MTFASQRWIRKAVWLTAVMVSFAVAMYLLAWIAASLGFRRINYETARYVTRDVELKKDGYVRVQFDGAYRLVDDRLAGLMETRVTGTSHRASVTLKAAYADHLISDDTTYVVAIVQFGPPSAVEATKPKSQSYSFAGSALQSTRQDEHGYSYWLYEFDEPIDIPNSVEYIIVRLCIVSDVDDLHYDQEVRLVRHDTRRVVWQVP